MNADLSCRRPLKPRMSMRLERSVSPTESHHKCWHDRFYPQKPRIPQDGLGVSDIFACYEEQQDVGKRRRVSAGMITEDVQCRVTAKQHNGGPRTPSNTNLFCECARNSRWTKHGYYVFFESLTACLDSGSFVWRECSAEFTRPINYV